MTETLLIGYGSELRGDDALGRRLAEAVEGWPGVRSLSVHQLTPELVAEVASCDRVFFADAQERDGEPLLAALALPDAAPAGWHHATPESLLGLCAALHGRAPEAWILTLPGRDFGLSMELSEPARASLEAGLRLLRERGLGGGIPAPPP